MKTIAAIAAIAALAAIAGCASAPLPPLRVVDAGPPDWPLECIGEGPVEPRPADTVLKQGLSQEQAAREHRRTLLWGRDLAGMRLVCRAWMSAYVAQRWGKAEQRMASVR